MQMKQALSRLLALILVVGIILGILFGSSYFPLLRLLSNQERSSNALRKPSDPIPGASQYHERKMLLAEGFEEEDSIKCFIASLALKNDSFMRKDIYHPRAEAAEIACHNLAQQYVTATMKNGINHPETQQIGQRLQRVFRISQQERPNSGFPQTIKDYISTIG
jgi:hypothetical protein